MSAIMPSCSQAIPQQEDLDIDRKCHCSLQQCGKSRKQDGSPITGLIVTRFGSVRLGDLESYILGTRSSMHRIVRYIDQKPK